MMLEELYIKTLNGFGDTIHIRPIVRALRRRWDVIGVTCSWPELFVDLDVRMIRPDTHLRTQAKHVQRSADLYTMMPIRSNTRVMNLRYHARELEHGVTILESLEKSAGLPRQPGLFMDLPKFDAPRITQLLADVDYVVVRPVTERREWLNSARNCLPQYIVEAARRARAAGFFLVSIADLSGTDEWAVPPLPEADVLFHRGELMPAELVELVRRSAGVISSSGWPTVMCQATGTPLFNPLGGMGGHNAPEVVTDPRVKHRIRFVKPRHYCMCNVMQHDCDRAIDDDEFDRAWAAFMDDAVERI